MQPAQYEEIFNNGERLVPGESHDLAEIIRHKSSYRFFRHIIDSDLQKLSGNKVRILDLGCGVGHGAFSLSDLPGVEIVGLDPSAEAVQYARLNYHAPNISYVVADAEAYLQRGEKFDYIVSRHALEHVENGLGLARRYNFTRRLMINVPYLEPEGNIHHKLHAISYASFVNYDGAEYFFEDMEGVTDTAPEKLGFANSIICILTVDSSTKVSDIVQFPFAAWQPPLQERIVIETGTAVRELQGQVASLNEALQAQTAILHEALRERSDFAARLATVESFKNELFIVQRIVAALRRSTPYHILRKLLGRASRS